MGRKGRDERKEREVKYMPGAFKGPAGKSTGTFSAQGNSTIQPSLATFHAWPAPPLEQKLNLIANKITAGASRDHITLRILSRYPCPYRQTLLELKTILPK